MVYNKFKKLEQLREKLGLKDIMEQWVTVSKPFHTITPSLIEALQEAAIEVLTTEKAKSEYIIVPILKELRRHNPDKFSTFSGVEFNVEKTLELMGYCDFMLSAETKRGEITAPVFCLIEAKDGEIDKGYAQCGADALAQKSSI